MPEGIGHINFFTLQKNVNRIKRCKKLAGCKTYEEFMLYACSLIEEKFKDKKEGESDNETI